MSIRIRRMALLLVAGCWAGAQAQPIYRCGSSYSQIPCGSAQEIQAGDARSPIQKQQADDATRRDAALARSLEKERQSQEKQALAPLHAPAAAASQAASQTGDSTLIKPQRLNSGKGKDFVAKVPGTRPGKKKHKKKAPVNPV